MLQFDPLDPQVSQQLQRSRSLFSSAAPPRIVVSAAPTALDAAAAAATSGNPVVVVERGVGVMVEETEFRPLFHSWETVGMHGIWPMGKVKKMLFHSILGVGNSNTCFIFTPTVPGEMIHFD